MEEKILFVDDEPNVLQSLYRELGLQYALVTAGSGREGLEKVALQGPFAVVVTDFRMPQMDGVQFLAQVKQRSPETVRMMLTGYADTQIAIDAVNDGQIFRFLTKPCPPDLLNRSLQAALQQYRLVMAEKELLEKTLVGSINMLAELLSMLSPKAYTKSLRVRKLAAHVIREMSLQGGWQYEVAAALSQLGWVIFPPALLDKIEANQPLTASEMMLFSRHPFVTKKLLEKIPRLELIARIIEGQERSIEDLCLDPLEGELYFVDLGSHLLKVCVEYDSLVQQGKGHAAAIAALNAQKKYHPPLLQALEKLPEAQITIQPRKAQVLRLENLQIGMVLAEPIVDRNGKVLVEKDTQVTRTVIVDLVSKLHGDRSGLEVVKVYKSEG